MPVERKPARENSDSGNEVEPHVESRDNGQADCRQLLAKREEELKEAQDRLLRLAAELDNTRKRLEREKADSIAYANESIMRQLIEVMDNLERAIEHGEKDETSEGLLDGVRMTHKSFLDVLARFGAAPFESVGAAFDPNRHEAVLQESSPDCPDMTVTKEFQKGYTLRDRLLRPARVGVARNAKGDSC
ncbi:MAG TPA: nucleotide exchange factor GrpE [Syntrophobacteraceae bacterium]|nr:nucleotide exchange factor GrpE [Syntrophobacteraceae bacterium]